MNQTRPFLVVVGTVFGLITLAHVARMVAEPHVVSDVWFWLLTIIAVVLSVWAWRLVWISRASKDSAAAS